ncbi:hypothetical protein [Carboxylicivirga caseinilyticus]|uniref:hypothetical protein n=1 Tax=Carboxylicivirga caseinilyticus TaxID=3417572 RepID=UPI003D34DA25|nr:hypothetical protein [Marinilabiliaceae bacterium A049]
MKRNYISIVSLLFSTLLLWQCEPKVDSFTPSAGSADFSKFIAIGDSYTAGYTDGALSKYGQMNSYSAILANQLTTVGSMGFTQPFLPDGKSIGSAGNSSYYLVPTGVPSSPVMPTTDTGNLELLTDPSTWINGNYQNVGVPGAKSFHLLVPEYGNPTLGQGNFNPFYARFASNPGTSTMLTDAMANDPTFFCLWLAGNDVLTYALSGGQGNNGGTENNDITDASTFTYAINSILATLTSGGAKGVMANIPDIEAIPHISYIQYNALVLTEEQATQMNVAYANYNAAAEAYSLPKMNFKAGNNAFVISDPDFPIAQIRQAKEGEKILLGALSGIQGEEKWGSANPIPVNYRLTLQAVQNIQFAINTFNSILEDLASKYDVAFVDVNSLMEDLKDGLVIDGNKYTNTFVTGGIFSLDGIHATGRGSAIIANSFIEAINAQFDAQVPEVNINDYKTVEFP